MCVSCSVANQLCLGQKSSWQRLSWAVSELRGKVAKTRMGQAPSLRYRFNVINYLFLTICATIFQVHAIRKSQERQAAYLINQETSVEETLSIAQLASLLSAELQLQSG